MVKIKVCGITNLEDAKLAVSFGAWALGFVFYKKSPRAVSPTKARNIIRELPPFVEPVGVFVNLKEGAVKEIADFCGLKTLQFHGDETPEYCQRFYRYKVIKAFRVEPASLDDEAKSHPVPQTFKNHLEGGTVGGIKRNFDISNLSSFPVSAYLFDAYQEGEFGGTGKTFNWEKIAGKKLAKPVILSGGLNPQNIKEAIQTVNPYAVDVSSGVEKDPGKKSFQLIEEFFKAIVSKG